MLLFNRDEEESIKDAFEYAKINYWEIKDKLKLIKEKYKWENIITYNILKEIYEQ